MTFFFFFFSYEQTALYGKKKIKKEKPEIFCTHLLNSVLCWHKQPCSVRAGEVM